MLNIERQNAICGAISHVCELFRGGSNAIDAKEFALAMLLLKYLSDVAQVQSGTNDKRSIDGCFVVPAGSSFYDLRAAMQESNNGIRFDKALHAIEEANAELWEIFQGISFEGPALGSAKQKDRVLCQLLDAFNADALNFDCGNREESAEAVALACDSLIRHYAQQSGKSSPEFFTPREISLLIARMVQLEEGDTIGDPCCGSGSLLITCSQQAGRSTAGKGCMLYGQEKNGSNWALAKMNMVLHGEVRHQIEWGDSLRDPKLLDADGSLRKFDVVVSSPPLSLRDWGHEAADQDVHQRYQRGVPPRASGAYAFISHMIATLKPETGRMAVVVSLGALFRGAVEKQIRERLLEENLIDAVIALPPKLFPHTGIEVAIMVMRTNKTDDHVLFIDASRSYQHGKIQNSLRETDLDLIEETYLARQDVVQFARLVGRAEIAANDSNLSVARYVDLTEDEPEVDLKALRAERACLNTDLASLEGKLAALLAHIGNV